MAILGLTLLLLTAAAVALLLAAGWRAASYRPDERDRLNMSFYHQRLRELEEDEAQGVVAERPDMVRELQQTLLTDIPAAASGPALARVASRWALLPSALVIVLIAGGFYLYTGGLAGVLAWQQARDEYPQLLQRVMTPDAAPPDRAELARLALGLRSDLQDHPQNLREWQLLGRIAMVLNSPSTARQAFQRATQLAPGNQDIQLDYLDALAQTGNPQDSKEASLLLGDLAKQRPNDVRVLSLTAFNAFQLQQYDRAIAAWQTMLTLLPADDRRVEMVKRSIEQAKSAQHPAGQ